MRRNLAQRQEAMKKKLLASRETFNRCAFREECCRQNPGLEPEFCTRCSASMLQDRIKSSRRKSR